MSDSSKSSEQTKSFEQNLQALEKVVERLESGSVSLDEAIKLFQKGRVLSRECEKRLKAAELKVQMLTSDEEGNPVCEPFETDASEEPDDTADEEK